MIMKYVSGSLVTLYLILQFAIVAITPFLVQQER